MLLSPEFLVSNWASVLPMVGIIILLKLLVIFSIVRIFGHGTRIALLAGAGLFQIGEFSFILALEGMNAGIVSEHFYSLILASAIITMLLTPLSISLFSRVYPRILLRTAGRGPTTREVPTPRASAESDSPNRVVIAGYGRVGQNIAQGLRDADIPYLVIDLDPERVSEARGSKRPRMYGDATNIRVLAQAGLPRARALVITYPDPIAAVTTAKHALEINPNLSILARVHRTREADELKRLGVTELISPEYEASFRFIKRLLNLMNSDRRDRKRILALVRKDEDITEFNPDQSV
jgi:CPA2 family monovalent cation:H+ antiporter-2